MSTSKGDRTLNTYCEEMKEQKMTCKDCLKEEAEKALLEWSKDKEEIDQ